MAAALTEVLGRFVAGLRYEDIPREAVAVINTGFTDCVAVMIAGAREPAPQLLKSTLAPAGGEATVLWGEARASALDAAWINGTAAHALDFDDIAQRGGHRSAVLVPAIIAEAEAIGAGGRQMVAAYAAGCETWAELTRRDRDQHHKKGWHPTGVFGAIAAAAACASLRGLDAEQAAHAIALGASQSAGLISNVGSMAKPFHAGRAAHAGVVSARLAGSGYTGARDALEHPPGLLVAVSPAGRIDLESPVEAGVKWKLIGDNGLIVKKYPLCGCVHRALDGLFDLLHTRKVDARKVKRVTVSISRLNAMILRNHAPQTGLEAKFSMEFAMACALIAGRAGLAELSDEFVRRPDVQALMKRVAITPMPDDSEDPVRAGFSAYDRVTIETDDGAVLDSGELTKVRGDPELPLSRAELLEKFEDCLRVGAASVPARNLFDALMSLNELRHIHELPGLARP